MEVSPSRKYSRKRNNKLKLSHHDLLALLLNGARTWWKQMWKQVVIHFISCPITNFLCCWHCRASSGQNIKNLLFDAIGIQSTGNCHSKILSIDIIWHSLIKLLMKLPAIILFWLKDFSINVHYHAYYEYLLKGHVCTGSKRLVTVRYHIWGMILIMLWWFCSEFLFFQRFYIHKKKQSRSVLS